MKKGINEQIAEIENMALQEPLSKESSEYARGFRHGEISAAKLACLVIQEIILKHDKQYERNCEEEAFRLKCYREELQKAKN